jgi:hypothetical protein
VHRGEGPRQIDRQHKVEEIIVEGAQIGMQDNPSGARIVDQDVEAALGGIDLAARPSIALVSCVGVRPARWPAPGKLAINCSAAAESSLKAAACHQRHLSIEHAPCWMTLFNRLQLRAAGPMSA